MLTSITPLGERGRRQSWPVTVTAYLAGSAVAGAAAGLALGGLGGLVPVGAAGVPVAAAACLVAAVVDLLRRGRRLPGPRRQVDETWLGRYRGWVYGGGYGLQLGLGVTTIVTTAAVYLVGILMLISGSAWAGGAVGATFGLVRALPVLALGRVGTPVALAAAARRLARWGVPVRGGAVAVLALTGTGLAVTVLA